MKWKASVSDNWILLSQKAGETATENRIEVSIDWAKVPTGEKVFGTLEIASDRGEKENVYISVFNPSSPSLAEMDSLFVEHNGYVSIDAAGFHPCGNSNAVFGCFVYIPLGCLRHRTCPA